MAHRSPQDVVSPLCCTDATSAASVSVCQKERERATESVKRRRVEESEDACVCVLAGEVRLTEREQISVSLQLVLLTRRHIDRGENNRLSWSYDIQG